MATQPEPKRRHRPFIRVFVSSTFSDLKHERNALAEHVWPHLEKYCQQRGFTFQAIDLRWGVPSEAGLDHRTMHICFEEIRRAQETSPQPNFLILLGNRYGWRPLPEVITVDEFAELQTAAEEIAKNPRQLLPQASDAQVSLLKKSVAVLEYWYRLDTNARPFGSKLPGEHVLRTRKPAELGDKSVDPLADNPLQPLDYGRPFGPDGKKEDTQAWKDVQFVLWSIVNRAFPARDLAGRFEHLTTDRKPPSIVRFQASATEQEIWRGAFEVEPAQVKEHVIAWFRTIEGPLPDSTNRRLKDFIDLQDDGHTPDKIATDALDKLRSQVAEQLGKENIGEGTCRWASNGDAETAPDVTTNHLDQMCQEIRTRLEAMVLAQISEYWGVDKEKMSAPDATMTLVRGSKRELDLECEDHERFARERAPVGTFVGREQELQRLRDYLHSDANQPYVVHGPSGSGKSALLGKIVQEVTPAKEADGSTSKSGPIVLSRFLGTTPESSTLRGLLTSLCRELRQHFTVTATRKSPDGKEETYTPSIPVDLNELIEEFYSQLGKATAKRPIYVLLDAIDQLDSADGGRAAYWVRSPLLWDHREEPCYARLIVSCLSPSDDFPKDTEACESYREFEARKLLTDPELGTLDPKEAGKLIARWLRDAGRDLTSYQQKSLSRVLKQFDASCQPLYLQVLFEEVRRWKSFDPPRITPATLPLLLSAMFERLGRNTEHDILPGIALSLIVSARYGLSEAELLEILYADSKYNEYLDHENKAFNYKLPERATRVPIAPWARLRSDLGPYLAERAAPGTAVLHFYHRQVERAAMASLLPESTERHHRQQQLATFFDHRWPNGDAHALMELPPLLLKTSNLSTLLSLLCDQPLWSEVKLTAGMGYDLLKDFTSAQQAAAALLNLSLDEKAAVDRCAVLARLLGNVIDLVQVEPSSVTAQLLLELQEHAPEQLPTFRPRWEAANRKRPWFERHSVTRRYSIPYVAQTGQRQLYLHSLTFSADSESLLYFDREGSVVRWDWKAADQSRTKAPIQGGIVRAAAVPSEQEVLLTDETTLWMLRVPDLWHGDLAAGKWVLLHRAETGRRLRALAACPERGYAVFAADSDNQGQLFRFRKGADGCEPAWRLPHAGRGGALTNHITFGDGGKLRAIGFGSGDLAVNTGFHGRAHRGGLYEAAFLAKRGLLATVGDDGTLALWDVRRGLVQRRDLILGAADCVDYCAAADLLAVGHRTGAVTLLQFNGDDLREEVLHPGVRGWVLCVRFSPCGRYLAVGGRNGVIRLFIVSQVLDELRRHKGLFRHIPQGPVEQAACLLPARVGFFLDQAEHLYSTGPSADSQHLPQKCETFCVGPQKGPVVLLPSDVRFLDPSSGRPRHIHRLPEGSRLASVLSPREDKLAVLEPGRLVVYALDDSAAPPKEVCAVALDALRAAVGLTLPTQRNAVPLCFCDDGRTVALPLEPISRTRQNTDGTFSTPQLNHRLCMIEVATGQLLWAVHYQGFCTALADIPTRQTLALGVGTGRVNLFDATERQPQGSYFLPSDDPGVVLHAIADGQVVGRLPLSSADDGVSALSGDPRGLLLVGCRSGRVRAASLHDNHWLSSVVLPAPVLGFAHQGSVLHCHAIDDGSTVGNWPVLHELLLWLPREAHATQSSGGQS